MARPGPPSGCHGPSAPGRRALSTVNVPGGPSCADPSTASALAVAPSPRGSYRPRRRRRQSEAGEQRRFSVFRPRGQGCRPGPTAPPRVQGPGPGWRPEAFAEHATQGQRKEVGLIALARLQAKGTVPGAMWPPDPEGLMRNVPEEPTREKHSEVSAASRVLFFKRTCLPAGNCHNGGDGRLPEKQ